jgi:hypothetical protein
MSDLLQPNVLTVAGGIAAGVGVAALCFPRYFRELTLRRLGKVPVIDAEADVFDVFGKWRSSFHPDAIARRHAELECEIRQKSPDAKRELALLEDLRKRALGVHRQLEDGEHVPLAATHSTAGPAAQQQPRKSNWREVLGVGRNVYNLKEVHEAYRRRAREAHPDRPGGSHEAMALVNAAYEAATAELEFD